MHNQEQTRPDAPANPADAATPAPFSVVPPVRGGRLSRYFLFSFGYIALRFLLGPLRTRLLTEQLSKEFYGTLTLAVMTITALSILLALGSYEFLVRRLPGLSVDRQKGWLSLLLRRIALPGWLIVGAIAAIVKAVGLFPQLTLADTACLWVDLGLTLWLLYHVSYALGGGRIAVVRFIQIFQNDLWFLAIFAAGTWVASAFAHALWIWTAWLAVLALAVWRLDHRPGPTTLPDGEGLSDVFSYGLPLIPMIAGEILYRIADRYLLLGFFDMAVVAEYTLAMNIAMMAYVTSASVLDIDLPHLNAASNCNRPRNSRIPAPPPTAEMRDIFSMMLRHVSGLGILLGLGLAIFRHDIFAIISGPEFRDAAPLLPWMAPIPMAFLLSTTASRAMLAQNRSRQVGAATLIAALLNLAMDTLTVPLWGARGAAISTFISLLALAIYLFCRLHPTQWISLHSWRPFRLLFMAAICAVAYIGIQRYLPTAGPWLRLFAAIPPSLLTLYFARTFTLADMALLKSPTT